MFRFNYYLISYLFWKHKGNYEAFDNKIKITLQELLSIGLSEPCWFRFLVVYSVADFELIVSFFSFSFLREVL